MWYIESAVHCCYAHNICSVYAYSIYTTVLVLTCFTTSVYKRFSPGNSQFSGIHWMWSILHLFVTCCQHKQLLNPVTDPVLNLMLVQACSDFDFIVESAVFGSSVLCAFVIVSTMFFVYMLVCFVCHCSSNSVGCSTTKVPPCRIVIHWSGTI